MPARNVMTRTHHFRSILVSMVLLGNLPLAPAAVVYSSLRDIGISADFDGVYLDVDTGAATSGASAGWDINPFFGGFGVANSPAFQPVRTGTGNQDALLRLDAGTLVNGSLTLATGFGGSASHLGSGAGQFAAGQEGYIGFQLTANGGAGPYSGWMRVVFTNNTGGAVIKDWAYENSGGAIATGRVLQAPLSGGIALVTLSGGIGETPSLGSALADPAGGGAAAVAKVGAGSWTLAAANSFTGATTVSGGTLIANATTGALQNTSAVNVSGGTLLLGASHQINNAVAITLDGNSLSAVALGTGGFAEQLGTLTLSSDSVIDLGTLDAGNALRFAGSAATTWNGTLSIQNWSGTASGDGADQVFFGADANGLTGTQLGQIQFLNPSGFAPGIYGANLLSNGALVPVPEPATIVGAAALLGLGVCGARRRVFRKG